MVSDEKKIQKLSIKGPTDTCPACGFSNGFRVSFTQHIDKVKVILICPECQARIDVNWLIEKSVDQMM